MQEQENLWISPQKLITLLDLVVEDELKYKKWQILNPIPCVWEFSPYTASYYYINTLASYPGRSFFRRKACYKLHAHMLN